MLSCYSLLDIIQLMDIFCAHSYVFSWWIITPTDGLGLDNKTTCWELGKGVGEVKIKDTNAGLPDSTHGALTTCPCWGKKVTVDYDLGMVMWHERQSPV